MTVEAKKIKTAWLSFGAAALAGEGETVNAADIWLPLDKVTIIGVLGRVSVTDDADGWDSGNVSVKLDVSRVAQYGADGSLLEVAANVICREATVGINANQTVIGDPQEHTLLMFPEGYGIDIDDNVPIYINIDWVNRMANNHRVSVAALIYYVER